MAKRARSKKKSRVARTQALASPSSAGTVNEPACMEIGISNKCSISLQMMAHEFSPFRGVAAAARSVGLANRAMIGAPVVDASAKVLVEAVNLERVGNRLTDAGAGDVAAIAEDFLSVTLPLRLVNAITDDADVRRVTSVKRKMLLMDRALRNGEVIGNSGRLVTETGKGAYVGIMDSGFDLSHPMFRAVDGTLRVDALLDQTKNNRTYTRQQLQTGWANGSNPGADEDGHGSHVATIAAGSPYRGFEGVAPDARYLLVKSDMENLAPAASWIFRTAKSAPCVINISLGHHYGAHDGSDAEERVFERLVGPGRIVMLAAGNERTDNIHIGARFSEGQTETALFDITDEEDDPPSAPMTLWYDSADRFDITLISSTGRRLAVPPIGTGHVRDVDGARVDLARQAFGHNHLIQMQARISFAKHPNKKRRVLDGWKLEITCRKAALGRIDGWFANTGYAEFRDGPLVETARTIGLPATSKAVIAVSSHVSKNKWGSDAGAQFDSTAVIGRSSSFSSRGPTRDGRNKPEISASGEYITAALAKGSESEDERQRVLTSERLLTIEGTSMATPFVCGATALALQRAPALTPDQLREALKSAAIRDTHTGPLDWTPEYGHGKLSLRALIAALPRTTPASAPRRRSSARRKRKR